MLHFIYFQYLFIFLQLFRCKKLQNSCIIFDPKLINILQFTNKNKFIVEKTFLKHTVYCIIFFHLCYEN